MKLETFATVNGGRIGPKARREIEKFLNSLEGKRIIITVDKATRKRTNQQNSYLHLLFGIFRDLLNELGNSFTMQEVKDLLKCKFLQTEVVNEETGEVIGMRIKNTSELTTSGLSEFIENVIRYGADEFYFVLPYPNEQLTL